MRHIVDYRAPLVLHPVLLKKYYPYLDDDASGHFQVGRGYNKNGAGRPLLGYFEPWNQQRFDPSEPYIGRVQWRDAYRSYRANQGALPAQHRRVMRRRLAALGTAVVLAGVLAGCADDEPRRAAAGPSSSPTSDSPTSEPSPTPESAVDGGEVGGSAASPVTVEPTTHLLEWTRVPGPTTTTVTRSGPWTPTVNEGATGATLGVRAGTPRSRARAGSGSPTA